MLDEGIEAVIVSVSNTPIHCVPYRNGKLLSDRHLQVRFFVPSQWILDGVFEEVHYCFAGVVQTRIGAKANRETLTCQTDTRSLEDFQLCARESSDPFPSHYLDFILQIPTSGTLSCVPGVSEVGDLPPSMSFSGSTYLAQHTALSDRQPLRGSCEVSYRIHAQFCRGQKLVQELSMPITLLADQQLVLKAPPLLDIAGCPRFNMWNIRKLSPTLSLDLFDAQAMQIRHHLGTQDKSISVPYTVRLRHVDSDADCLQSLRCTVEARWCTRRSFAITKLNNKNSSSQRIDQVFRSDRQTRVVYLPPLWPIEPPGDANQVNTYAAKTDIVLFVPDCVAGPTIQCGLLSRTYTLQLSFCFEACWNVPRYTIRRSMPVKVQMHDSGTEAPAELLLSGSTGFHAIESDATPPPFYAVSSAE